MIFFKVQLLKPFDLAFFLRFLLVVIAFQQIDVVAVELLITVSDSFNHIAEVVFAKSLGIGQHNGDIDALSRQRRGNIIIRIVQIVCHVENLHPGILAETTLVVQCPVHCGDGISAFLCYVLYGH